MSLSDRIIETPHGRLRLTESDGAGLPVLLLHGASSARTVFNRQMRSPLAERHRLVAVDLPGHGQSTDAPDPDMSYSVRGLANAMAAVVDALDITRFAIFGWSLGGHVAIEMMSFHPGIAGVMLSGAPPVSRGPIAMLRAFHTSWDMLLATKEHFSQRDIDRYARLCYGDDVAPELRDAIERTDGRGRAIFARSLMRGEGADQRQTVEHSRVPVAMVNGEHDPFIRLGYIAGLDYRMLWENECYVVEGAGHAVFRDAPATFETLLLRFASDVALRRSEPEQRIARRA